MRPHTSPRNPFERGARYPHGILQHFCRFDYAEMNNALLRSFLDTSTVADIRATLQQHTDLQAMTSYIQSDDSPQTQGVLSEPQQSCVRSS